MEFDELSRPDHYDHRLESERDSEIASRAACGVDSVAVPIRPLATFEWWYHYGLTVEESIRYMDCDSEIKMIRDENGNFVYPWRERDKKPARKPTSRKKRK